MTFYGQSKPPEDFVASVLFGDYIGVAVEVGAFDGVHLSNCYHFYLKGWQCINFEPHPDNYAALCVNQPKAINWRGAVGEKTSSMAAMQTAPGKPIVTGFDLPEWYVRSEVGSRAMLQTLIAGLTTLSVFLSAHQISTIDYVSIDTDGTEMDVLAGLDFSRWQPRLFIVEYNHALDDMKRLFFERGYQLAHDNGLNGFWTRTQADYDAVRRAVQ